ncbi:MAG TPA: rod shape-determining protein MreC [Candidatus Binataceae bacterium]|nr:rod shape-determining protein MreC [Candidatus Binataceae bacterium]
MRSTFLWRNRVLLTTSGLLLLALHLLSAGVKPDARAGVPAHALLEALAPGQRLTSSLVESFNGVLHGYTDLVRVREENLELRRQLASLESERAKMLELEAENRRLADLLELRDALEMKATAVDVIGTDATAVARTLIIGQGSRSGLRRGMAVVAMEGVVGKLIEVTPDASRVLLIDDHNSALDALDQRSRARGIIAGVIDDGLTMKYVDRSEDIKPGDTIVTSGMDGIYPHGLLVGEVEQVSRDGPGLFLNVEVRPAVDFRRLEQLLVLTEKPPELQAAEGSN